MKKCAQVQLQMLTLSEKFVLFHGQQVLWL